MRPHKPSFVCPSYDLQFIFVLFHNSGAKVQLFFDISKFYLLFLHIAKKLTPKMIFLPKYLHVFENCSIFAAVFEI